MPEVSILITAKDQASRAFQQVQSAGGRASQFLKDNWKQIAAGAAVAGVAIEAMGRKVAAQNEAINKLALATGMQADEIRNLAIETANVTRPIDLTLDLFKQAQQQGLAAAEDLHKFAAAWDTIGDATGENASQLAKAGVALRGLGIAAGEEEKAMDAFGFIMNNTTMSIQEFLMFIDRAGPEIRELGLDVNETAAIIGIMQEKFGMSARTARTEFTQAVSEADGDLSKFLTTLNITTQDLGIYTQAVKESEGAINDAADAHAESYTLMQRISHMLSELQTKYGKQMQTVSQLAPVLIGLATAITAVALAGPAMIAALKGIAAGFVAVHVAGGPLLWILEALVLAVGIFAVDWEKAMEKLGISSESTLGKIFTWLENAKTTIKQFGAFVLYSVDWMVTGVVNLWEGLRAISSTTWAGLKIIVIDALNAVTTKIGEFAQHAFNMLDKVGVQSEALESIAIAADNMSISLENSNEEITQGIYRAQEHTSVLGWMNTALDEAARLEREKGIATKEAADATDKGTDSNKKYNDELDRTKKSAEGATKALTTLQSWQDKVFNAQLQGLDELTRLYAEKEKDIKKIWAMGLSPEETQAILAQVEQYYSEMEQTILDKTDEISTESMQTFTENVHGALDEYATGQAIDDGIALAEGVANGFESGSDSIRKSIDGAIDYGTEKLTLATTDWNKYAKAIAMVTGPTVAGPGGPLLTAQQLMATGVPVHLLQEGGIVTKPISAIIGEGGKKEAVIPLDRAGNMGFGKTITNIFQIEMSGIFQGTPATFRILARELIPYIDEEQGR